jgi:hypothetical protein
MHYLPILLSSLVQQPMPLTVFVLPTDRARDPKDFQDIIDYVVGMWSRPCITLLPLQELGISSQGPNKADFGYLYTDLALQYLLKQRPECLYFLFTNGDNFYVKAFAAALLPVMDTGLELIGYEFLTHYRGFRHESDNLPVQFKLNHIDLGSAVVRKSLITATNATFVNKDSVQNPAGSDGFFFQYIASHTTSKTILKNVLFLHQ